MIELIRPLDNAREHSPLARARLARQLTVEEVAKRAELAPDQVRWLEEGRVYRFPSADDALLATLLYASALGIEHREALELAGRPVPAKPLGRSSRGRLIGVGAAAVAVVALAAAVTLARTRDESEARAAQERAIAQLPPTWKIAVSVLNGSGDINHTRRVADRIGALGYGVAHVGRADRFDYQRTAVYYERGGQPAAIRLARALGVVTKPLPSGSDPRRLLVVVGPPRGPR